jgi:hypothetical protein
MSLTPDGGIPLIDPQVRGTIEQVNTALLAVAALTHGILTVDISAGASPFALTAANCRARIVKLNGTLAANRTVTVPTTETGRNIIFQNATAYIVTVKLAGEAGAGVAIPAGQNRDCYHDGAAMKQTNA